MSPSQELGAQDVFKNKCLINLRWYRLARTPPPRASDREADPLCQQHRCDDGMSAWWEPVQACLRGPAWLPRSSMEITLIAFAFSLNMEGHPFHSIFFFLKMIWILQRSIQGYYGRELSPNLTIKTRHLEDMTDPCEIHRLLLQTWKKILTHNEKQYLQNSWVGWPIEAVFHIEINR